MNNGKLKRQFLFIICLFVGVFFILGSGLKERRTEYKKVGNKIIKVVTIKTDYDYADDKPSSVEVTETEVELDSNVPYYNTEDGDTMYREPDGSYITHEEHMKKLEERRKTKLEIKNSKETPIQQLQKIQRDMLFGTDSDGNGDGDGGDGGHG